ncbi:MAG: hypothetical protein ACK5NU_10410 [Fusobacterium ulcerans]
MKKVLIGVMLLGLLAGCGKKEAKKLANPENKIEQVNKKANTNDGKW